MEHSGRGGLSANEIVEISSILEHNTNHKSSKVIFFDLSPADHWQKNKNPVFTGFF